MPYAAAAEPSFFDSLAPLCCVVTIAALIAAGVVAAVLLGRRRSTRPGGVRRPPARPLLREAPPEWRQRPAPGQIWWAEVPFTDGSGSKRRPCLVVRTGPGRVEVLKITSQDRSTRRDHIRIPTRGWDKRADHDSWLDLGQVFTLADGSFTRHAGSVDAGSWQVVVRSHPTGWYQ
ncbi:MAG TPA: type II toxin-antitoxin system PemK/MazF family toxin [Actinocatenispora sp.]